MQLVYENKKIKIIPETLFETQAINEMKRPIAYFDLRGDLTPFLVVKQDKNNNERD